MPRQLKQCQLKQSPSCLPNCVSSQTRRQRQVPVVRLAREMHARVPACCRGLALLKIKLKEFSSSRDTCALRPFLKLTSSSASFSAADAVMPPPPAAATAAAVIGSSCTREKERAMRWRGKQNTATLNEHGRGLKAQPTDEQRTKGPQQPRSQRSGCRRLRRCSLSI